jgi:hypothetical protein
MAALINFWIRRSVRGGGGVLFVPRCIKKYINTLCWQNIELFNPLNAELNSIRHFLALAGAHHFVDVSRIRVSVVL